MDERVLRINEAAAYIKNILGDFEPLAGIVLGSGLGKLADKIENPTVIAYKDIPNFSVSTAVGHKGNLIAGQLGGKPVLAMQGRFHYYEGYPMEQVTLPIRVMKVLGIKYLFVSNAAGGVNFDYKIGDLMIIRDHLNLLPNPLIGKNMEEFGPRFPDMTRPYEPKLIKMMEEIASQEGIALKKGVYLASTGPTYETPAEYKYFRTIGADAVGMSTIPEVIVARHSSIPVFGMSVITNEAHDDYAEDYVNDGDDVVKAADAAADKMTLLFTRLISQLD
ncbi:MAG: purine-nucleoside phosphorylase [Bacteroidales bacterium]|nr:purine-nucleoside phosphorylase [Bacteroidales bacterium]MBP3343124.1 purine-nucleoside phosphorylase [Bacteroidales bacterium]MBQ6870922.1 purine-nucleoside phosphorylase [Bacteroidales bacterium]MBQ7999530.1 purine-nucleoside phosphorylase [Bacteroidales bacterium]MBR4094449.1 purine-nucleoside phosphorylase [Bacteroidales bacterium]